jgi:hypothetical protein
MADREIEAYNTEKDFTNKEYLNKFSSHYYSTYKTEQNVNKEGLYDELIKVNI